MKISEYLSQFMQYDHPHLKIMAESNAARDDLQPSIEPEIIRFICLLIRSLKAKRVLELGTSNGYSAIWIAMALKETGGHLWTVDNHERTSREALENIKNAGFDKYITMLSGNADKVLEELDDQFDLVFQDCGKSTYPVLYENTVRLTRNGGLIIADDTLFSLDKKIRKNLGRFTDIYNEKVFSDERLYSVILPVGHGLTISWKK